MKKVLICLTCILMLVGSGMAKEKKDVPPTEIEALQVQFQALSQQKQQVIKEANTKINNIDKAMLRVEGAILYLQEKGKKK